MINTLKNNTNGGYVVILHILLFMMISVAVLYAITEPLLSSNRAASQILESKKAFVAANSAVEETLYKMKTGKQVPSSETLTLDGVETEITTADTMAGKVVTVSAQDDDVERNVRLVVAETTGVSFNYGLQVGRGGFAMSGGANVHGNVYSNGNIIGSGGPYITGSATAANGADPDIHQSNGGVLPPPQEIRFGGDTTPLEAAQSFTVSTSSPISGVRVLLKKQNNSWMQNITMRIVSNNGGKPGKQTIASGVISASQVTTSFNYLTVPLSNVPPLQQGTTYWIVFDTSVSWNTYYALGATSATYSNGVAKTGTWNSSNGGTWTDTNPAGLDAYFDIYVGGETAVISGITIGANGVGDAWAHTVNNANVAGTIYCQASNNNNKACDTSRPSAAQQPFPISDGNIEDWKSEAAAGGVQAGNLSYGGADIATLGPTKIVGNLTVSSGAILYVEGTLWVTGNIVVNGGGKVMLSDNYGNTSGVIVSDGRISVSGGGTFSGAEDQSESYLIVVTTSTCPTGSCGGNPAIDASGGTGAVVLNAQKGTIEFSGGAQTKQATAERIEMVGGTSIRYESGLADMSFSSGPSGSWSVESWEEI